jgi:hypothetical protein
MYNSELGSVRPHFSSPKPIYDTLDLVHGVYTEQFPAYLFVSNSDRTCIGTQRPV